jgi:hypothetical protein
VNIALDAHERYLASKVVERVGFFDFAARAWIEISAPTG